MFYLVKELTSEKSKLVELVDYQEGSIVSKTLIDKKSGSVTLFAFDKAQKLSEHTAPYDALVYVFDGECEITIGSTAHQLTEGDLIIMPANIPHSVRALTKFKMLLTMIKEC